MTLQNKVPLIDLYIEEMQFYQSVTQNPNRTTTGQATYQNPRTLNSYSTVGTSEDNNGQAGLARYMYNTNPKLKDYIFDDETYNLIRTSLNALDGKATLIDANSKGIATNSAVIDELVVNAGISTKIAPTSGKFYDFVGSSGILSQGSIDFAKTFASTVTTGTNTVLMTSLLSAKDGTTPTLLSDCFEVGEEITLANDSIREIFNITNVDDGTATLTLSGNIAGTFASGANVYRSNVKTDTQAYKFGGFNAETVIDQTTPVQVVNAAYDTSGNGGRKIVRLDSGRLISTTYASGNSRVKFYFSDNDGDTWIEFVNTNASTDVGAIATDGVNVYHLYYRGTSTLNAISFNGETVTAGTDVGGFPVSFDTGQTSFSGVSLAIAPNGDLHATWASKNATYPNSFNIRYSKSTDGGVTWGTVQQVTQSNSAGTDNKNPSIVIASNGLPVIIVEVVQPTQKYIYSMTTNGTTWSINLLFDGSNNTQSNPSADVLSDGTIIVAWHGTDSTDATFNNIRFSQSTDNGVTWSAMEKLTSGNTVNRINASITRDKNDYKYIVYDDNGTLKFLLNNGSWQATETIATGTNPSTVSNYREFTKPLTLFDGGSDVKFYGKWAEGTETDVTTTDIRFNITPLEAVSDIGAYLNISNNINTVDAQVSVVGTLDSESYTDLVDTRYSIDANNDEVASLLNASLTANEKVTLKYTLNRSLTTDDIDINSILGGVA